MLLLLAPFAIALVVVSVLGLAGIGPLTDERRAGRDGIAGGVGPAIGLLMGGGVLVVAVAGSFGLAGLSGVEEGGRENRADPPRIPTAPTTATAPPTPTTLVPPAATGAPVLGPLVTVEAEVDADDGGTFPASYDVADRLDPDTVLSMFALGFEPFARAIAQQCAPSISRQCANPIPVQFDAGGEARFQYLISDDFLTAQSTAGGCRADTSPCTIEVRSLDGATRGSIQTIFGDELPPPGRIAVKPSSELSLDGDRVTVEVWDYPPGVEVTAMLCAAPDAFGPRCGLPGPTATITVGADGTGRITLVLTPGPVGDERASCSRGDDCGITVVSDVVFARAAVVPITWAAPPGAAYDPIRLALGLAAAVLLLIVAALLLVRTDWAPVGEAAAPEIDDAEYADLDAIIAALPPEEDDLVSTP